MRLFVAIDPPAPVCDALASVQGDLSVGRLSDPETFHLTLAFLGEVDPDRAEEAHAELEGIAMPGFDLALSGVFALSEAIVAAGVADATALADLHGRVLRALRRAGVTLDRRRFRPHVTLARLPRRISGSEVEALRLFLARNGGFRSDRFTVRSFALYASTLHPDGALHEPLAHYPLG